MLSPIQAIFILLRSILNIRGLPVQRLTTVTVKTNEQQPSNILGTATTAGPAEMGSSLSFLNVAAELEMQGSKVRAL